MNGGTLLIVKLIQSCDISLESRRLVESGAKGILFGLIYEFAMVAWHGSSKTIFVDRFLVWTFYLFVGIMDHNEKNRGTCNWNQKKIVHPIPCNQCMSKIKSNFHFWHANQSLLAYPSTCRLAKEKKIFIDKVACSTTFNTHPQVMPIVVQ